MNAHQILTLQQLNGFGLVSVSRVLSELLAEPSLSLLAACEQARIKNKRVRGVTSSEITEAEEIAASLLEEGREKGIKTLAELEIPPLLRGIPNAPNLLFARGNIEALKGPSIAIVGSRSASDYGLRVARRWGAVLAEKSYCVISGLALGCDAEAHLGCLESQGQTVAVLPCGLDQVYPSKNQSIADRILDQGGCLVSEYSIRTKVRKDTLIQRDRLQSGLAFALLLVESGIKGGSMQTVKFAEEQSRLVGSLAHPDNIGDAYDVEGNRTLVHSGRAIGLSNRDDLERFLNRIPNS